MNRAPRASTSLAERGATMTMNRAAGMIAAPASSVVYPSTFWRYCWPMNIAPMSEPNTMIPAQAATQKIAPRGDVEVVQRVRDPPLAVR